MRTWEIQCGKSYKNRELVTVDFSVRIGEIQQKQSHKNEKVTLFTSPESHRSAASSVASSSSALDTVMR
eukprot:SAG31_NODE_307_length_17957_cov_5.236645_13_plen_69_part_00